MVPEMKVCPECHSTKWHACRMYSQDSFMCRECNHWGPIKDLVGSSKLRPIRIQPPWFALLMKRRKAKVMQAT